MSLRSAVGIGLLLSYLLGDSHESGCIDTGGVQTGEAESGKSGSFTSNL